jgi:hypothetical protein
MEADGRLFVALGKDLCGILQQTIWLAPNLPMEPTADQLLMPLLDDHTRRGSRVTLSFFLQPVMPTQRLFSTAF